MDNNIKKETMEKLLSDLYADYLKHKSVIHYLKVKHFDEIKEDLDEVRKNLADVRTKAEDEKISEEETKECAIKIAELEGRIDLCEQKREEVRLAEGRIEETIKHYNYIKNLHSEGVYNNSKLD